LAIARHHGTAAVTDGEDRGRPDHTASMTQKKDADSGGVIAKRRRISADFNTVALAASLLINRAL